jgi:serine phosphatase RsbU (regulator of sigma subunit)
VRYESLRALAIDLATATSVDEVAAATASAARRALDALVCGVLVVRQGADGAHSVIKEAHRDLKTVLADCPVLLDAMWKAVDDGAPARLDLDVCETGGVGSAEVHPIALESRRVAVVVLAWGERAPAAADIGAVVGLCRAALVRAWATRRVRELVPIMDALLDQAAIGLAFLDTDLRYQHVNDRLAAIHRQPVSDHLGRTLREMTPHMADAVEPLLRKVIRTGEASGKIEVAGRGPDGSGSVIFEVAYLPVEVDGDVVGVAAVVDDVTEDRVRLEELRHGYEFERDVAARLQRGLTPRDLHQPEGYEVATSYAVGSTGLGIGGDWYDVIELRDGCVAFVMGDVVGHGLDSALAMVRLRHALAGLAHSGLDPVDVLGKLDEYATDTGDQFVATVAYGLLEPAGGGITLSSAGHLPPLLITSVYVDPIHAPGTPVGVTAGKRIPTDFSMDHGDTLLLYTDGVIEERGESVAIGLQRLMDLASRPFSSAQELADRISAEAARHNNSDDAAVMVLRRF